MCVRYIGTGINHEGQGNGSPTVLEWRTLVQIVPAFSTNTARNSPKHATSSEKFIFFWSSPDPSPVDSTPHPNQAFWIGLCVPLRIPAMQITPMYVRTAARCSSTVRSSRQPWRKYAMSTASACTRLLPAVGLLLWPRPA